MKILLEKVSELNGWKSMEFTDPNAIVCSDLCICCLGSLKVVASITNTNDKFKIELGCCPDCGFVTYINKPTRQWIINFYNSTWNQGEDEKEFVNTDITSTKFTEVLNKMNFPKTHKILEIGVGRGGNFAALINNGYKNLIGVENSDHRAKMVSEKLQVHVLNGGFEEDKVQNPLNEEVKEKGKFNLIYTAHVIEHVYNPDMTIGLCADLQDEGDYLVIAIPNQKGEPSMGILEFFPHLHSFTEESLKRLLNRKGYEVVDRSNTTETEIFFVAKKTKDVLTTNEKQDYIMNIQEKFNKELHLDELLLNKPTYYWFHRKNCYETGLREFGFLKFVAKRKNLRAVHLKKIDISPFPLTMVWPKEITLFYK